MTDDLIDYKIRRIEGRMQGKKNITVNMIIIRYLIEILRGDNDVAVK